MKIKDLLTQDNWIQGEESLDQDGEAMNPCSEFAFCWCLVGAARKCCQSREHYDAVIYKLANQIGISGSDASREFTITKWNDNTNRTFEDVKQLIEALDI